MPYLCSVINDVHHELFSLSNTVSVLPFFQSIADVRPAIKGGNNECSMPGVVTSLAVLFGVLSVNEGRKEGINQSINIAPS